jgi:hypothetical protein
MDKISVATAAGSVLDFRLAMAKEKRIAGPSKATYK